MIKRIILVIAIVVFVFTIYRALTSVKTKQSDSSPVVSFYTSQALQAQDDNLGTYKNEESIWTNQPDGIVGETGLSSGKIRKDERTGLWWSASSLSDTITNRLNVVETDGHRLTGGEAIAFCDGLNRVAFGGKTDWYLPTQKELMQAYIDGIYSQDPEFGTRNAFWASTVFSTDLKTPWCVDLAWGFVYLEDNFIENYFVRCVRRD